MKIFKKIKSWLNIKKNKSNKKSDSPLPKWLRKEYVFNEDIFKKTLCCLRNFQKECLDKLNKNIPFGQVIIPTGTGKTYIQKCLHVGDMIEKTKNHETGIYVVAAHRLTLCTQLFNNIIELIILSGLKVDLIYLGSESFDLSCIKDTYKETGILTSKIDGENTTSGEKIIEMVKAAKEKNSHVLIVSTYHSFHRLEKVSSKYKIDMCTLDEVHTTVGNQSFKDNITLIKPNILRQYSFTATKKVIGDDGGQNDINFYGPVLYPMSPKEAIDLGEIVQPRLHVVYIPKEDIKIDQQHNITMVVKTIEESFNKHKEQIKKDSGVPNLLSPKLLVTTSGLDEIRNISNSEDFRNWCLGEEIEVFSFSSDDGYYINFQKTSRKEAIKAMLALNDQQQAIFFHYDILTEGIDLPNITGVLLLRDLQITKLLQNIGRAARLIKKDRYNFYSNMIDTSNKKEYMIKPYSYIIMPIYIDIDIEKLKKVLKDLRDTYKIPLEIIGIHDTVISQQEDTLDSILPIKTKIDNKEYDLEHDIENLLEEILVEELDDEFSNKANEANEENEETKEEYLKRLIEEVYG